MASATTSLVRDLGQTLGPAIIGAVALGMAASQLTGSLAGCRTAPQEHGIAPAVLHEGGPLALHTADLGPLSAKLAPYTTDALAHGYNAGLILTAVACVAAAVIAAVFVGVRRGGTRAGRGGGERGVKFATFVHDGRRQSGVVADDRLHPFDTPSTCWT